MATTIIPKAVYGQSLEQPDLVQATPEKNQSRVLALIQRALRLIKQEVPSGDEQSRVLWFAQKELGEALDIAQQVLTDDAASTLLDQIYDCSALCLGAAALSPDSPLGAGATIASQLLDSSSTLLDCGADFWPEGVCPAAAAPCPSLGCVSPGKVVAA